MTKDTLKVNAIIKEALKTAKTDQFNKKQKKIIRIERILTR